jgi:hypothetical protein
MTTRGARRSVCTTHAKPGRCSAGRFQQYQISRYSVPSVADEEINMYPPLHSGRLTSCSIGVLAEIPPPIPPGPPIRRSSQTLWRTGSANIDHATTPWRLFALFQHDNRQGGGWITRAPAPDRRTLGGPLPSRARNAAKTRHPRAGLSSNQQHLLMSITGGPPRLSESPARSRTVSRAASGHMSLEAPPVLTLIAASRRSAPRLVKPRWGKASFLFFPLPSTPRNRSPMIEGAGTRKGCA